MSDRVDAADYGPSTWGERWADRYDAWVSQFGRASDADAAVRTLAGLARGGSALELAVGTGRVALPLAEAGIEVHGIDASQEMVSKLRAKPGGEAIPITMGDFADVGVTGTFDVIYVVFNTFFALPSQADQVRCFANVAAHLADGGVFVVELFVPDVTRFDRGQRLQAAHVGVDDVSLEASVHDPLEQRIDGSFMTIRANGIELLPVRLRYAWPAELDLMARLAGLELKERWGGWDREPFTARSGSHVSVYGRP